MKTKIIVQSLFICVAAYAHVANADIIFTATLSGDQEVPSVTTPASGSAIGELSGTAGSYVFTYEINYTNLSSPIIDAAGGGHFHNATAGNNGPVVHLFDTAAFAFLGSTDGTISGDWRFDDASNPLTDTLANELIAGNMYINLHTEIFNGGELRGQLFAVTEPTLLLLLGSGLLFASRRKTKT
ncbi:CHRD domain-containing protein [Alteromonas sp. ASW11-130]|uniref:CHRD domain-containing protein n=1 Tax=Alteromonas sp. ASW11-130 TaxID=3015775 RepID=UPI0022419514|nr:CHRD domain-containing protein [Alteromonas sp. ASW11-130]MCW8091203.1 CHRD domain-containing protein [Alteromonas sp. ASW11-130]